MLEHICLLLQYGSPNCAALLQPKTFEADTLTVKKRPEGIKHISKTDTHTHTPKADTFAASSMKVQHYNYGTSSFALILSLIIHSIASRSRLE